MAIPAGARVPLACMAAAIAVLAASAAQDPLPQAPAPEQPIFRAKIDLVRVDVSVTDDDGAAVSDLVANDFAIREDDVPQTVQTVQFLRLDGQPLPNSIESLAIRSPAHAAVEAAKDDVRVFAILLDDYHVDKKPHITLPLRRALAEFIEQLGPRDLVTIMDPLTPLSHLRFTRARDELLERIRSFEGRRGELYPVKSLLEEGQLTQRNVWELRGGVSLSALTALATHLGGLREGRKSVLFVSQGPPIGRPSDPNFTRMEEAIEAANRGNVTINVLDPRPLGSSALLGPEVLWRLSRETGGRAMVNQNDPSEGLSQVIADASAYYLVGYTPSRELADGKFHRIDVAVKRRGVRVLARRGYWAPRAEELNAPPPEPPEEPALAGALATFAEPMDGRVLDTWIGLTPRGGGRTELAVTWEPSARRSGLEAPSRLSVEPVVAGTAQPLAPSLVIASATSRDDATVVAGFELAPGPLALRFVAYATNGEVIDRWTQSVALPPPEERHIELATPRVFRARTPFEIRELESNPRPVPSASRRFRTTDRVLIEIECRTPEASITAELVNQHGRRLLDLTVPPLTDGQTRVTVPLSSLARSVYAVRVRAVRGDHEQRHLVPFQIVP
jgi:VWFA-related protein